MLPALASGANAQVLDLCGGTGGFYCLALRHQGIKAACVIGDFSGPMLRLDKGKKLSANAWLKSWTRLNPPFRAATFDVVLCGFGMRNLDNLRKGIARLHMNMKPRGRHFLTLDFFSGPARFFTRFFTASLAPIFIPLSGIRDGFEARSL